MENDKHECDVCRYVDGDRSGKESIYCGDCDAWICPECSGNYLKRSLAMCIRWLNQEVKI